MDKRKRDVLKLVRLFRSLPLRSLVAQAVRAFGHRPLDVVIAAIELEEEGVVAFRDETVSLPW